MSNRADDRPRILGDPPTAVRPAFELEADAVRLMLTSRSTPRLMELLGMDEQERTELAPLLPRVAADEELLGAVAEMANLLRREAGLDATTAPLEEHTERLNALQERILPGQGLLVILAHMVATDVVRAWHAARGLGEEESWRALSDLGQQMRVHRATFGELGHHTVGWTALNWTGRLFWLGRLQFDLHRAGEGRWQIGTHIPATGRLLSAEVDASFDRATTFFTSHFGDLAEDENGADGSRTSFGHTFVCHSWLVNAELPEIVGPESNLGAFAARWEIEKTFRADDDAVFFVFNRRPPYEPTELPTDTRLRTALVERLLDGRGWTGGTGRLTRS
ncbi:acyltransferase domain-containing protein [Brachybacterium muris]|uniref:acyltransferase domain-containing protein n=1 Tax=Brachybacterium muris TaxID=219301 RepID=UPI00223B8936|nr:acyltransferase domain-containing protein [Brachybacterium muris]MCT1653126.1 acyltransferase domain-containing protein [Brachybacterium muris]MCT2260912.1 acyltransferase domain-containing protein [Brachybacterium muris]